MLRECCYFWDLQAGTVICSTVIFTVLMTSFIANLSMDDLGVVNASTIWPVVIIYSYLIIGIISSLLAITGARQEKKGCVLIATIGTCIILLFWILMLVFSLVDANSAGYLCLNNRCPELHWLDVGLGRTYTLNDSKLMNTIPAQSQLLNIRTLQANHTPSSKKVIQPIGTKEETFNRTHNKKKYAEKCPPGSKNCSTNITDDYLCYLYKKYPVSSFRIFSIYFLIGLWICFLIHAIYVYIIYWSDLRREQYF